MTRLELVDQIIELLRRHKDGRAGSIHQDPYKSDFFRLFADAYNAGMMHRADQPAAHGCVDRSLGHQGARINRGQDLGGPTSVLE
jgi:hypothetical protein